MSRKRISEQGYLVLRFKNCQLMRVTESFYRRSGRAKRNPTYDTIIKH
jgi:very-short-patch-repair endonuclease